MSEIRNKSKKVVNSIGVGIMAAQYWGKGDGKSIEKIAPTGLRIILVIGGMVTLAALFIPSSFTRATYSFILLEPSRSEYSVWVWRCTNAIVVFPFSK